MKIPVFISPVGKTVHDRSTGVTKWGKQFCWLFKQTAKLDHFGYVMASSREMAVYRVAIELQDNFGLNANDWEPVATVRHALRKSPNAKKGL